MSDLQSLIGALLGISPQQRIQNYIKSNPSYQEWEPQPHEGMVRFGEQDQTKIPQPPQNLPMQMPLLPSDISPYGSNKAYQGYMRNLFPDYRERDLLMDNIIKPSDKT